MTLTKEDLAVLQFPFKAAEHEFLKDNAYITEGAITDRIEAVDPSWTLEQISLFARADSNQVVCTMRLTIKGVWRDGVGMTAITKLKSGAGDANEAEKAAATDALKRAARLFGIGRYLLDLPKHVVNVDTLRKYLIDTYAAVPNPMESPPPTPQPPPSQPATPPAASEPARNGELRNEELVITRVEARPDSAGWYGYGMFDDGTSKHETRVNLFSPEDPKAITDAGYQWVTSGKVQWPVVLKIDRNMARIDTVVPVVIPETPQNANLPQSNAKHGQPDTLPSWFETPAKDCWGAIKQYLLNNMYDKNTFHMNGSLDKHGITENKGQKLRDEWVNSSAGSLIKYLSDNRELAAAS